MDSFMDVPLCSDCANRRWYQDFDRHDGDGPCGKHPRKANLFAARRECAGADFEAEKPRSTVQRFLAR